ncbi:MAG TPA: DUF4411 family protein [Terriglobales bacterium]|nr:DUF4411 family protein [Terriglobales bacterium]
MIYLLDANILITAANTYYDLDRVPEFWTWLHHQGTSGNIKIPLEIYEEVLEGRKEGDALLDWAKNDVTRAALLFKEKCNTDLVRRVVQEGYANDLTDDEVEKLGRDPFLISYGLNQDTRCIATTEVSKPSRIRHNRHIPDVCSTLKVNCCGPWDLNKHLGFKTGWKP